MDENRIPRNCNLMGKGDETIKIEGTVFSEKPMRFACPISKNAFLWVYDVGIIFWYIKHIDCMWYFISMGDSGSRVSPMSSVENRDATNIVHNRQSNHSDPSARSGDACRNTSGRRWCVGMGLFQELFQSSFGFSVFQRIVCSVFLTCWLLDTSCIFRFSSEACQRLRRSSPSCLKDCRSRTAAQCCWWTVSQIGFLTCFLS